MRRKKDEVKNPDGFIHCGYLKRALQEEKKYHVRLRLIMSLFM